MTRRIRSGGGLDWLEVAQEQLDNHSYPGLGDSDYESGDDWSENDEVEQRLQLPTMKDEMPSPTKSPPSKRSKIERQEEQQHQEVLSVAQSKDAEARELIIRNICAMYSRLSCGSRSYTKDEKILLNAVGITIMSEEVKEKRLVSAMTRVAGISKKQQNSALKKIRQQAEKHAPVSVAIMKPRASAKSGRFASLEAVLVKIVQYFHNKSPLVEIDKSRPDDLTGRYGFKVAGQMKKLTCRRRLMRGTKRELVAELKTSPFYGRLLGDIGRTINDKKLESCICHCIQPRTISECSCGVCVEFKLAIETWHKQRKSWHKKQKCSCAGCSSSKKDAYFGCSSSVSTFFETVLCSKVVYPHLKLPHFAAKDESAIPKFRPLRCCVSRDGHPRHMVPCSACGWDARLYDCPTERTSDYAYYKKWQDKYIGKNEKTGKDKTTKVLQTVSCTRLDLLERIKGLYKDMAYHRWVHFMTRHQEQLEVATFNAQTDILVKTDFAAVAQLQAGHTKTCEWPTSAHENVALVLHSPQPLKSFGAPRQVTCDIWRTWSDAKQNEEFHQVSSSCL